VIIPDTSTVTPPSPVLSSPASPRQSFTSKAGAFGSGFPSGYFVIRSCANGRLLDVARGETNDGTEIILWSEKEKSLVEGMRDPDSVNQVFFLDYTGALCSKIAGLPVDTEDSRLVIRHHRPITHPFPNEFSHPLPRFSYDKETGFIRVAYASDPCFPAHNAPPSQLWKERDYLLTSVPLRRPKSVLETTTELFSSTLSHLTLNPFGGPAAVSSAAHVGQGEFDLREDEVLEEERLPDEEEDDSPSRQRDVHVLDLPLGWMEEERNARAVERRRWEVVPLLPSRNVTRPQPRK